LRSVVQSLDPEIPLAKIRTMDELVQDSIVQQRFRTYLVGSFALLAAVLAAIGIYAVVSFTVGQQTREIGVRMALGADRKEVVRFVLLRAVVLAAAGMIIGACGAFVVTRLLRNLLFAVTPGDPVSFVGSALALMGVATVAALVPALRAASTDPVSALRTE
jgi:ABC-type antimicrobial peptide transport system permease subunit